jgi:hypothetical protein
MPSSGRSPYPTNRPNNFPDSKPPQFRPPNHSNNTPTPSSQSDSHRSNPTRSKSAPNSYKQSTQIPFRDPPSEFDGKIYHAKYPGYLLWTKDQSCTYCGRRGHVIHTCCYKYHNISKDQASRLASQGVLPDGVTIKHMSIELKKFYKNKIHPTISHVPISQTSTNNTPINKETPSNVPKSKGTSFKE